MLDDWITTKDAARISGYHPERVRELAQEGKITARKWGPAWMISRQSVLDYAREMRRLGGKRGPKKQKSPGE
jgi:hypothetical protein